MKTQQELFHLIKSLTKSEKRHFTIFASTHVIGEKNNYLRLFKAIDAQDVYDEQALRDEFKGEVFLKQLPVTKNYLCSLILKSMRSYRTQATIDMHLQEMIQDIEFLYEKGLEHQCRRMILKAKELAHKHQKDQILLHILEWQRKVFISTSTDDTESEMLFNEEEQTLQRLHNLYEYSRLSSKVFRTHIRRGKPRSQEEFQEIENLLQHPLLQNEATAFTDTARARFYNIHTAIAQARSDSKGYYENSKSLISLLEKNPSHKKEGLMSYASMLHNFLDACSSVENYEDLNDTIEKLRTLPVRNPILRASIFCTVSTMELSLCNRLGRMDGVLELLEDVQSELTRQKDKIHAAELIMLHFNISLAYFILGNYSEALKWANQIINSNEDSRTDIQSMAKLFSLIIHLELGNLDYIEYSLKSTYNLLSERNQLFRFEIAVLEFLKKIVVAVNPRPNQEQYKELYNTLLTITEQNPLERLAVHTCEILPWLEGKLQNMPLKTVIKSRTQTVN